MFYSNHFSLGHWDITNLPSSNVIYDEQSPFPPPSPPASMFEESAMPATEGSVLRVQVCEKAEDSRDIAPEKKSTLNENQSLLQKNVSKRDPPSSLGHSDKKNLLKAEHGVTQRGRSISPKKSASHYSEEHLEKIPSPLKNDPKRRPRDRSLSPRKGETKSCQSYPREGSGHDHGRKSRGRSSSPKQQKKPEGNKDQPNAEAKSLAPESRRAGSRARDNAEQISNGKEKLAVIRKDAKQSPPGKHRTRSPEKKSKRTDEKSLSSKKTNNPASRVVSENEKGKRGTVGETSSSKDKIENVKTSEKKVKQEPEERTVSNRMEDHKGREPEAKKTITPGPWKVPSASKAAGTAAAAEKRL